VQFVIVTLPYQHQTPAPSLAAFPAIVQLVIVGWPCEQETPPPPEVATFPKRMQLVIVGSLSSQLTPPP
jgi:hypothetical protein